MMMIQMAYKYCVFDKQIATGGRQEYPVAPEERGTSGVSEFSHRNGPVHRHVRTF